MFSSVSQASGPPLRRVLPSALDGLFGELTPASTPMLPPTLPLSLEPTACFPQSTLVSSTTDKFDDDDDFADFAGPVASPTPADVVASTVVNVSSVEVCVLSHSESVRSFFKFVDSSCSLQSSALMAPSAPPVPSPFSSLVFAGLSSEPVADPTVTSASMVPVISAPTEDDDFADFETAPKPPPAVLTADQKVCCIDHWAPALG